MNDTEMLLHLACECNLEKFITSCEGMHIDKLEDMKLSCRSQLGIINLLLDHGVDINATNLSPMLYTAPFSLAASWRSTLHNHSDDRRSIDHPNIRRRLIVQYILERGAAINTRSLELGKSFLHLMFHSPLFGSLGTDSEIMKIFIEHGVDLNARDKRHFTPLHVLVKYSHFYPRIIENIELLLNCGADVNARNVEGMTPISQFVKMHYSCPPRYKPNGYCGNIRRTLNVLLVHVQRLLTLGLTIDDEIRDILKEGIDLGQFVSVEKECADELTRMKQVQVHADTSLYRLLRTGLDGTGRYFAESKLQGIVKKLEIAKKYPHYAALLQLRIRRGQTLKKAESAMKLIVRCELPYLCTEVIFRYLSNWDLRNLVEVGNIQTKLIDMQSFNDSTKCF